MKTIAEQIQDILDNEAYQLTSMDVQFTSRIKKLKHLEGDRFTLVINGYVEAEKPYINDKDREMIRLRKLGLTYRQIADVMQDISYSTVRRRLDELLPS